MNPKTVAVTVALVLACAAAAQAAHYAVLVAGSNTFSNYRHQTDIAHAYNVLLNHGIPAANIITFLYDDIANDDENPYPGQLFNKPTAKGVAGTDVYKAIKGKIDYTGEDVTPENFLAVIQGNSSAVKGGSGKVLKSGKNDTVFINFSDHGGTDLIAFPDEYLYVQDLTAAIKNMHKNNLYGQLVFYLEACESGSMFEDQGWDTLNAYAVSASEPDQDSWGYYCGDDESGSDTVNGVEIGSCLGDLFSINWMEDSDKATVKTETLQQQYTIVFNLTNKKTESGDYQSQPQQYGALSTYNKLPVINFIGSGAASSRKHRTAAVAESDVHVHSGVPSADATLHSLYHRYKMAVKSNNLQRITKLSAMLQAEIALRTKLDNVFAKLTQKFGGKHGSELLQNKATAYPKSEERSACYREVVEAFAGSCGRNDYNVKYMRVLSNLCAFAVDRSLDTAELVDAVTAHCNA